MRRSQPLPGEAHGRQGSRIPSIQLLQGRSQRLLGGGQLLRDRQLGMQLP
jgi:hypothetical protein